MSPSSRAQVAASAASTALFFAGEGAKVVVNDLGGTNDGTGADATPAQQVVDEIKALGGEAVANGDNVADWQGAQRLINTAIEAFGDLDILVNNAGILRDRVIVNMTEEEWDAVIAVHLKGHFAPSRWAAAYWREQHKAGITKPRNLVHTSSHVGPVLQPGSGELRRGEDRHRHVQPDRREGARPLQRQEQRHRTGARTRLTLATPGPRRHHEAAKEGASTSGTRPTSRRSSPTWPAPTACSTARRFLVQGGNVTIIESWSRGAGVDQDAEVDGPRADQGPRPAAALHAPRRRGRGLQPGGAPGVLTFPLGKRIVTFQIGK